VIHHTTVYCTNVLHGLLVIAEFLVNLLVHFPEPLGEVGDLNPGMCSDHLCM